ncbi:helix-turn-helix domain-containing protein [Streptomyces sp. NPDC003860]
MSERVLGLVSDGEDKPSSPPCAAARLLGAELRRLRVERGLIQSDVVGKVRGINSVSVLSRSETGRRRLCEEEVVGLARFYGVTDPGRLAELRELLQHSLMPRWWSDYPDVVAGSLSELLSLETTARVIDTFEAFHIPGLLQTPDYARAVMRVPVLQRAEGHRFGNAEEVIQRRLKVRARRQQLLEQEDAPEYSALIEEGVLNRPTGGRAVLRHQLRALYSVAENKPRVHIRVLPFAAAEHASPMTPSMTHFQFPSGVGDNMAYTEATNHGGTYHVDTEVVEAYRANLTELWMLAGSKEQTLALLESYIDRLVDPRR